MAMEVVCGNCQGRLLIEHMGVVVACPHCGAHLQIGEAPSQTPNPSSDPVVTPEPASPPVPVPSRTPAPEPVVQFTAPAPQPEPTPVFFGEPGAFAMPPAQTSSAPSPISFVDPPAPTTPAPEPNLPEIILTPPANPPQTSAATQPAPVPVAATDPMATPMFGQAPAAADNDSWMPKINLEVPPDVLKEAHAAPVVPAGVTETSTLLLPPKGTASAPSPDFLAPNAPAPVRDQKTAIWTESQLDAVKLETPQTDLSTVEISGRSGSPSFPNFGSSEPKYDASTASTMVVRDPDMREQLNIDAKPDVETPAPATVPAIDTLSEPRDQGVPRYLFVMVASYASAITLAFLYLWWRGASVSTIDLPDIKPPFNKKTGKVSWQHLRETPLPSAYTLKLGESKRFGNLMVTPVKVTKGPLEFVYYVPDEKMKKPPTQNPVLKLWVKFENVSEDQTFPALDEQLLYQRTPDKEIPSQDRSNNYVCLQSERNRMGRRIPVYAFPIHGDWLLKGQNLDTELKPHDTWETYIPTNDEDLSSLDGALSWRLQFRKGYNPQSGRGVTTVVEVEFDSKDIKADS